MSSRLLLLPGVIVLGLVLTPAFAAEHTVHVTIEKVERPILVHAPASAKQKAAPLVFVFHGHHGSAEKAAKQYDVHGQWPEAVVVYLQGRPIKSKTDPEGKEDGWQHEANEVAEKVTDRDLKYFDAALKKVKETYKIDEKRVYAMGQSNGGGFTQLLWATRGDTFAAVAPSAASSANNYLKDLKPKPVLHVAGKKDETAPFDNQEKLIEKLRTMNKCDEGKPYGKDKDATLYPSKSGTPVVTVIHSGGHVLPESAVPVIVRFFKEHQQK